MENYTTCTWDEKSDCANCSIAGKLACKWDKKILTNFHLINWTAIVPAIFGMIIIGYITSNWWILAGYIGYFLFMFGFLEIRFLCSHCPYYAKEGKTLHCLGNHGAYKFWKYRPGPLNKLEKFMMNFLIATMFFVIPISVFGYGITYVLINYDGFGLITLLGLIGLAATNFIAANSGLNTLKRFYCPNCVNFSCPLNEVPKENVDIYLLNNPVMRKAWEDTGWKLN
ncbi:MAG: hypothetical protein HND52_10365 [Ignavibacteriae bacterium]|nr:hypothetical protein [Ignavibacteriota bacterium]NOG98352.1 hypothetical protein [Ignavibacteriota bacterium]